MLKVFDIPFHKLIASLLKVCENNSGFCSYAPWSVSTWMKLLRLEQRNISFCIPSRMLVQLTKLVRSFAFARRVSSSCNCPLKAYPINVMWSASLIHAIVFSMNCRFRLWRPCSCFTKDSNTSYTYLKHALPLEGMWRGKVSYYHFLHGIWLFRSTAR